jgi:hypothetical protein
MARELVFSIKEINVIFADKVISNVDDYYSSDEYIKTWERWQGKERSEKVGRLFKFINGFVVNCNPLDNYGREYHLFRVYKSAGMNVIKEEHIGSSLNTQDLRVCILYRDGFALTDHYIDKSDKESLKLIADKGHLAVLIYS